MSKGSELERESFFPHRKSKVWKSLASAGAALSFLLSVSCSNPPISIVSSPPDHVTSGSVYKGKIKSNYEPALRYSFKLTPESSSSPSWPVPAQVNSNGLVYGVAPKVKSDAKYYVEETASWYFSEARDNFVLTVQPSE